MYYIEDLLRNLNYKPINEFHKHNIKKSLYMITSDIPEEENVTVYSKVIQKNLKYEDSVTGDLILEANFNFALVFIVCDNEIVDSFAQPLNTYRIRTEKDKDFVDEILSEFQKDIDKIDKIVLREEDKNNETKGTEA